MPSTESGKRKAPPSKEEDNRKKSNDCPDAENGVDGVPRKKKRLTKTSLLPSYYTHYTHNSIFSRILGRSIGTEHYSTHWKSFTKNFCSALTCADMFQGSIASGGSVDHGAVFNLEFSLDGKYLVAACEKRQVAIFDPVSHKEITFIPDAHHDCVNCVTFLDTRAFATCSDDTTIALWDIRNLKSKVANLVGHSSWVKSISYNPVTKQLISSAFADTLRSWDVNSYSDSGVIKSKKILKIKYLTRSKLSPDFTKMLVATRTGVIVLVHDLDLADLKSDWRFIQTNDIQNEECQSAHRKNRIEYLSDFPPSSNPWCVSSLQVHPLGIGVLSRYTSQDFHAEWTAIHDIQDMNKSALPSTAENQRLIYCIKEPNVSRGYIKEPCFNNDGRLIASPFANGVRLLAYNSNCDELPTCEGGRPRDLTEVSCMYNHKYSVLTTRFSPHLPLMASGCLGGQVSFYQPKF